MRQMLLSLLLCIALGFSMPGATAQEAGEWLSQEDLYALQPAYEAFLDEMALLLVRKGLLEDDQIEAWRMAQLGDYVQNGGFGMIATMYNPDLLDRVRPQDQMLRLSKQITGVGTLRIETMRGYMPLDASLPGLLLRAEFVNTAGLPVETRFRWYCDEGVFLAWDAFTQMTTEVGATLINDGRPAYWSDQPPYLGQNSPRMITIEILSLDNDLSVLGEATLHLSQDGEGWVLDEEALQ